MDGQTASKLSYSWGGRFHLAFPVDSEFGVASSLKTFCGQLHNPKTIRAILPWGNVPNGIVCRECVTDEGKSPADLTPDQPKADGPDLKVWGDGVGEGAQEAEDYEKKALDNNKKKGKAK